MGGDDAADTPESGDANNTPSTPTEMGAERFHVGSSWRGEKLLCRETCKHLTEKGCDEVTCRQTI